MSLQLTLLPRARKHGEGTRGFSTILAGGSSYLHVAWAMDESGTGFTRDNKDEEGNVEKYDYMGLAFNSADSDEALAFEDYIWTFVGCCKDDSGDDSSTGDSSTGDNPADPSSGGDNPADPSSGGDNPDDPSSGGGTGGGGGDDPWWIDIITGLIIGTIDDLIDSGRVALKVDIMRGRTSYVSAIGEDEEDGHLFIPEYNARGQLIGNYTYYKSATIDGKTYTDIWLDLNSDWEFCEYNPTTHEYRYKYFQGAAFKIPEGIEYPRFQVPKVEPKYLHPTCHVFYSNYNGKAEEGYNPLFADTTWHTLEDWENNCPLVEATLDSAYVPTI